MTTTASPRETPADALSEPPARRGIIDTDVHPNPRSADEIRPYLPPQWRKGFVAPRRPFFHNPIHANRLDSTPPDGGPAASDPAFLREQLMDTYGVSHPILVPRTFCNIHPNPDYGSAIAAAYNEWLAETWLGTYNYDGAFKGSITINHHDPLRAAEEIERWAGHPHMVQVVTDSGARAPLGQRQYYPIYEACERHGLPFAIHPGSDGIGLNIMPTPGVPTHYIEYHCGMALAFQAHLLSYLTEGVFERFPTLRVAMLEGGVAWVAPLMWRLDAYWRALRRDTPWITKPPSEYLRDHVRLSTQPLERPAKDAHLLSLFDAMDAEHILMFSSDYPHWDFDSPTRAFPKMPEKLRNAIMTDNASALYGL
ncbi:amidohydrolase family protein [Pseudonocardia sp. TRM90224]|uniref:amidohydrolase family protein n=1 Tax=Pseudonocardia sp. TRM90224 TaxID=2812678 RepID=UPI001E639EE7|nr:amidohydrolase family protein [Pseudonocardia sp. TRM90224]